jgi:hypothetical protein
MLPRVSSVRVDTAHDRVLVVEDITLPRGDWQAGAVDLFVAFGAPGTPIAFDARWIAAPSETAAAPEGTGEAVTAEPRLRNATSAQVQVGPPHMAGMLVHIKEAQLQHVYAQGDAGTLRLRSLLAPPAASAEGARDIVVRLGSAEGMPLTLSRVEIRSVDPHARLTRAEASLCGPDADAWPLSVDLIANDGTTAKRRPSAATIPPELAVRHPGDDLCVRWWSTR